MSMQAHRINGAQFPARLGQNVRVIGRVLAIDDQSQMCRLQMPDGVEITVSMSNPQNFTIFPYVEVVGQIQSATEMTEMLSIPINDKFNMPLYNSVLQAAAKHPEIF